MANVGSWGWVIFVAVTRAAHAQAAPLLDVLTSPGGAVAAAPVSADEAAVASLLQNSGTAPLVVNFFATWCGSCAAEIDLLQAVLAANPGTRGVFVSLDRAADAPRVARFVLDHRLVFPVVHVQSTDPGAAAVRLVPRWPERIPVTLLIAPGGAEVARFVGRLDGLELAAALARPPG